MKPDIAVGDKFEARVVKSEFSNTLGGEEGAGRSVGTFKATKVNKSSVESKDLIFQYRYWRLMKVS